jgi:hypothetical protein
MRTRTSATHNFSGGAFFEGVPYCGGHVVIMTMIRRYAIGRRTRQAWSTQTTGSTIALPQRLEGYSEGGFARKQSWRGLRRHTYFTYLVSEEKRCPDSVQAGRSVALGACRCRHA